MVDERIINPGLTSRESDAIRTSLMNTDKPQTSVPAISSVQDDQVNSETANREEAQPQKPQQVHISDLFGEYGNYQFFLTVITFVRYFCLAMMTNTGPLIAPELTFWCKLPEQSNFPLYTNSSLHHNMTATLSLPANQTSFPPITLMNFTNDELLKNRCSLDLANGSVFECHEWTFDQSKSGVTLTDAYNLICDRDWLKSAFQSFISFAIAFASVAFGATSDEHGRRFTMNVSLVVSLLAGLASYWAPSYLIYTLTRALCTMCDLCIAGSLYTIIVETLGVKYRGIVCLIVTTGWSIGVMIMPWVTGYFRDFRKVMLFTVACHVATLPWLLLVGESPRWLLVNGKFKKAHKEMYRICTRWNFKTKRDMIEIEERFETLKNKSLNRKSATIEDEQASRGPFQRAFRTLFGSFSKIDQLFKSKELLVTSLVFIWIIFNSELLYMMFIFVNSDHNDSVKLNYAIGGLMETLATLISIIMISTLSRRLSLSLTLTTVSISMVALAFTHDKLEISVYSLNFAKLAGSTLTSLVFVILTELFPTSLRQTGSGITATLGSTGGIIAPFVHNELSKLIGFKNVLLVLCVLPLSAASLVPFLRETKGVELADDIDEIES